MFRVVSESMTSFPIARFVVVVPRLHGTKVRFRFELHVKLHISRLLDNSCVLLVNSKLLVMDLLRQQRHTYFENYSLRRISINIVDSSRFPLNWSQSLSFHIGSIHGSIHRRPLRISTCFDGSCNVHYQMLC